MSSKTKLSLLLVALLSQANASQNITLEPITVSSLTKGEESIHNLTANIEIISKEQLQEKRIATVAEALQTLPGVNITTSGGLGSVTSVMLRGMGNNRTLVLIDGIRFQDPSSTTGAIFSNLMVEDIERIEIIKGAQSGIWGADASAGVINIITKEAKKGLHADALLELGSFNSKKYGASLSHNNEDLELKLSVNRVTSDSFSVQAPKGDDLDQYEDDPYKNTTLGFKAVYKPTQDAKIKFNLTNIDSLKDYDSYANPNDTKMQSDSNSD